MCARTMAAGPRGPELISPKNVRTPSGTFDDSPSFRGPALNERLSSMNIALMGDVRIFAIV